MFLRNNKASVARAKGVVGTVSGEDREVDRGSIIARPCGHHGRTLDFIVNVMDF